MGKYTVDAERSGRWWVLQAVEAPGAISQVDDFNDAEAWIKEAISAVTDEPEDDIEVTIRIVEGPSVG